jgi:pre-mRNA-splicing factor CWC22
MVIECCSQERSYSTFYGLVSERFCKLNRVWNESFESAFETYYDTIHRYESNRLRNIARLFGHLLANDAISWTVLQVIRMNEDDTTSSSRIFVKIMMQEVTESMGLPVLKERFADPEIKALCTGMFPLDNPKNTRFSINYFTSVGLGALTEEMREHLKVSQMSSVLIYTWANILSLKNAPRLIMEQRRAMLEAQSSSSDDSSESDSSSDVTSSDSDSGSDASSEHSRDRRSRRRSPSLPRDYRRDSPRRARDVSRTPSPPPRPRRDSPRRRRDDSRTPSPSRSRRDDDRRGDGRGGYGRDRRESPPRYRRRSGDSISKSPPRGGRYERERERSPPRRDYTRDRDRSREYERRRDDSRDRYGDRRR